MTMINYKQKALDHVRSVCPELNEPVRMHVVEANKYDYFKPSEIEVVAVSAEQLPDRMLEMNEIRLVRKTFAGRTPHLEHWLRGLEEAHGCHWIYSDGGFFSGHSINSAERIEDADYNLTNDGENQSEEFYKAYCEIVGV